MNEQQQLISETLHRLLEDHCPPGVVDAAEAGEWPAALWQALTDTGLTLAGIPEEHGGSGGDLADSLLVLQVAAKFGAPVPLAEHFMAGLLLSGAGQVATDRPMTVATGSFSLDSTGQLKGVADDVAFARWCDEVILTASAGSDRKICRVRMDQLNLETGCSVAGEPRDRITVDVRLGADSIFDAPEDIEQTLKLMGAATRAVMMAGALDAILEMSVQYAMERAQFGRPISKFQAIQHQLAVMAGEVAASSMASHGAVAAFQSLDPVEIAIAKARVGEAVSAATDIAHGVHGAMGYTMEHSLNHRTRRLWCWREEYGSERYWQKLAGAAFLEAGADGLWNAITSRG